MHLQYRCELVNTVYGNNSCFCENRTKYMNKFCEQSAELLIFEAGGTYT
jgi:hypothetical protein